jgi:GTP-binding protein Era
MEMGFKSGFVGIVGPTNSGKSTLLNALLGKKISIVSPRAQTTYHGIRGIQTTDSSQMIYVDTPGFQRNKEAVARLLNKVADKNAKDCDLLLWVFDASNEKVVQHIEGLRDRIAQKPPEKSHCLLNKIDKIPKGSLLPLLAQIHALGLFSEIIPISAKKGDGVERIKGFLSPKLPDGNVWYQPGEVTDRSQDFVLSEFIREKIYEATREELPYTVWVEIENWGEIQTGKVPTFHAVLHVDSESRKGILIGKQGEMLKRIGVAARKEIETYLGHQVCLKILVKVQPGWREDGRHLNRYLELDS